MRSSHSNIPTGREVRANGTGCAECGRRRPRLIVRETPPDGRRRRVCVGCASDLDEVVVRCYVQVDRAWGLRRAYLDRESVAA